MEISRWVMMVLFKWWTLRECTTSSLVSYTANRILLVETPLECKRLSYKINGVDQEKWNSDGYEVCFGGVREKFKQNLPLLQLLKTTSPKILAEATHDRLWGTGIALHDTCALQVGKWHSIGWLSCMLMAIRDEIWLSIHTKLKLFWTLIYWHYTNVYYLLAQQGIPIYKHYIIYWHYTWHEGLCTWVFIGTTVRYISNRYLLAQHKLMFWTFIGTTYIVIMY